MENNPFVALLIITGLALVVPLALSRFRRIRLPIVVGEIFAGIVIGRSGFDLIEASPSLTFLAEFGFAFIMFLSGLEVDFNLLLPSARRRERGSIRIGPLAIALLLLAGTILLALLGALGLRQLGVIQDPLLVGLILSTTSLGVVVPVLKEQEILGSRYGQYLLVAASLADFLTLILLTILIAIGSHGLRLDLLLIPVLLLVFVLVARVSQKFASIALIKRVLDELSSATAQIRVRGAFALMVAFVVLADAFGVELILGAFLAGAIAGLVAESGESDAREKLEAIGFGFFIPIFFIMVGVDFNLRALFETPQGLILVPLLLALAYIVKIVPALILRLQFSWRETLAGGFLLSSRLSLIIAASSIALGIGAISEAVNADIILLAIISCTISPLVFNRLYQKEPEVIRSGVIIIGQDQMAEMLATRLLADGERVTMLCPDESRIQAFQDLKVELVMGCPNLREALERAGAATARGLLDLTTSSEETLNVCSLAREQFEIPYVVSRIADVEQLPRLQELGVKVVEPALATAMALEGALRYPTAFDVLMNQAAGVEVDEVQLTNRNLEGTPMRKIRLPGDAMILSVRSGSVVSVPNADTVLQRGDRLGLIGSREWLNLAIALLRGEG